MIFYFNLHCIAHVTAKMICDAVMVLVKLYTAPHMWPQKWGAVQLWFWLNHTAKCGAKNGLKLHGTSPRTPLRLWYLHTPNMRSSFIPQQSHNHWRSTVISLPPLLSLFQPIHHPNSTFTKISSWSTLEEEDNLLRFQISLLGLNLKSTQSQIFV